MLFAVNISSCHKKRQQGLTLVEVLIALAIMAILFGVLAPNIHTILSKNRITAAINAMSSVVQYGRFSAIDQNGVAVVCPSHNFSTCSDNWNLPKIVFIDANTNNQRDNNEPLLMTAEASSSQESFTGPDVPITFEEANFIKEQFIPQFNLRELMLIPEKVEVESNIDPIDLSFESVDTIVMNQIEQLDSESYDKRMLTEIYRDL